MLLSPPPAYHGMQADKACDYSGVSSFAVAAVEYTLAVILHILRVDRDDKESVVYLASVGLFVFLASGFAWF
jgi:hypothetical protein